MTVHHSLHVREAPHNRRVNVPLPVPLGRITPQRLPVFHAVLDDIVWRGDQSGGEVAREEEGGSVGGVPDGDVAEGVEDGLLVEDVV